MWKVFGDLSQVLIDLSKKQTINCALEDLGVPLISSNYMTDDSRIEFKDSYDEEVKKVAKHFNDKH